MSKPLILMACSGTKLGQPAPAQDLYQGVMWQSLRANAPDGQLPHIVVLSAMHGFIPGSKVVEPYDKFMTPVRARELEFDLEQFIESVEWPEDATRILLAGGGHYRYLMRRMVGELIRAGKLAGDLEISEVTGGIGLQRSQVGRFVRDPSSLPIVHAGYHPNGTPLLREAWGLRVGNRVRTKGLMASGKTGARFARVEELFMGPSGPTASVEFEDDRPPLANGKVREPHPSRGAWVGVGMLARAPEGQEVAPLHSVDPARIWKRIPGLELLANFDGEANDEMGLLIPDEAVEYEAESPRMH
ncbi:DUF6884 domain-containing protein [Variovorax sp. LjRoot178]|uniref:DUF6884 domain-containing protein n=1 Tax=Variovorax sp. LjRoot178 TaxID=3342277 RepID=UPI003ECE7F4A